jgi:hypothetical protein
MLFHKHMPLTPRFHGQTKTQANPLPQMFPSPFTTFLAGTYLRGMFGSSHDVQLDAREMFDLIGWLENLRVVVHMILKAPLCQASRALESAVSAELGRGKRKERTWVSPWMSMQVICCPHIPKFSSPTPFN